ncbi:MAG: M20 family metallopeptidase [Thermotogae bacterium]|nr:M20 family metallopeptidase [Thermotogota bacterium]
MSRSISLEVVKVNTTSLKEKILREVDDITQELFELAKKLKENPEIGFKEYQASEWITEILEKYSFEVEKNIGGLETAFKGTLKLGAGGPKVAFLCEYDALPEVGHGCGHNLIAAASLGAAISLSRIKELNTEIIVFGCPGEENGGGKVILVEKGLFDGVDIAMMVHPSTENCVYSTSLALDAYEFEFKGRSSHAAGAPEKGINALDAVIHLFNGINSLRQYLREDVRIHGIISEGGKAPNVIPDRAVAKFYFRAKDREYLNEVVEKIFNVAKGAATMVGAKVEWRKFELSNDDLKPNKTLAETFERNLRFLGVSDIVSPKEGRGSTDMGNVSQVVPAIHPHLSIGDKSLIPHSREFAQATMSENGKKFINLAAKTMALTALDVLTDEELFEKIKKEFMKDHD